MAKTNPSPARLKSSGKENDGRPKCRVTVTNAMTAPRKETKSEASAHCQADAVLRVKRKVQARMSLRTLLSRIRVALIFIFSKVWKTCPVQLLNCWNMQSLTASGSKTRSVPGPRRRPPRSHRPRTRSVLIEKTERRILPQYREKFLRSALT